METKKHNFGGKNEGTVCHKSHNISNNSLQRTLILQLYRPFECTLLRIVKHGDLEI